jgi:hypothetical protein
MKKIVCRTNSTGYWSKAKRKVPVKKILLNRYNCENIDFGELRVYFDKRDWNTKMMD